jgi:biotin transport system substrate-specific component
MEARARVATLSEAVLPRAGFWEQALLVVGFSVLNALAAQVAIPLPFSPVPITAQTFAVLVTGMLLGSRLGAAALVAYLAEGLSGVPVFAGGRAGPLVLLGPTGGYLVGFVASAYVVGWLAERGWDRRPWTTALAMALGNVVIYAAGVTWLANLLGPTRALEQGLLPFLPGDLLKLILAATLLPAGWRLLGRARG